VASVLDANFNPAQIGFSAGVPRRTTNIGPRFDYAINSTNTLIVRYNFFHFTNLNGLGGFNLLSKSYPTSSTNHNIQVTETAVLNAIAARCCCSNRASPPRNRPFAAQASPSTIVSGYLVAAPLSTA